MPEYRTEFIIPPDRYLCLQLPPHLPSGRATITVTTHENEDETEPEGLPTATEPDLDREDIEWWDEFGPGDDDGRDDRST